MIGVEQRVAAREMAGRFEAIGHMCMEAFSSYIAKMNTVIDGFLCIT
jgi:hypothetical protein